MINDGFGHIGDTIRFPAVFLDENGNTQTGLSPTISFKILTASSLLAENAAMTEDSELPGVYYYEYVPVSSGVYFAHCVCPEQADQFSIYVIGDGAIGNIPADVWNYATRTVTEAVGISEEKFHEYLESWYSSVPPGTTPTIPAPPASTAVVLVYKNCRFKDDNLLTTASPTCEILADNIYDGKAYYVPKESMTFENGVAMIYVPPHCKVRVRIPAVAIDEIGWVGAGGTTIEADALYAERQI